jgi:predicted DNA-binding transcriptional regulator AlpA
MNTTTLPVEGYVRLPQVLNVFPISKSSWWAGVADGRYPQPVKLSPRVTAWKVEDIRRLIDEIGGVDSRDGEAA